MITPRDIAPVDVEALATLRRAAQHSSELAWALGVLDEAGVFAEIDAATDDAPVLDDAWRALFREAERQRELARKMLDYS